MEFPELIASPRVLGSFISFSRLKKSSCQALAKKGPAQRLQMAASKLLIRPAFQILFKRQGLLLRGKRKNSFESPRSMFCGVRASPLIMFRRTPREIAGYAAVVQRLISLAYYDINVVKVSHLGACQAVAFWSDERLTITQPAFTLLRRGSLHFLRSAPKAKAGGEGS